MVQRSATAALAAALLVAGAVHWPGPHAEWAASAPQRAPEGAESRARLLERHGEPALAWIALREAGASRTDAGDRLAVRLLAALGRFAEADSLLARVSPTDDPRAAFLHRLQRARLNYDAGRYAAAHELLAASVAPDAALDAWREYLLTLTHLALDDPAAAEACLGRLDAARIPGALRPLVDEERVRVLRSLGRSRDALAAAETAARSAGDAAQRRALTATGYELAREGGDDAEAVRLARRLFTDYRSSEEAGAVAADMVAREDIGGLSAAVLLECARVLAAQSEAAALKRALRVLDGREMTGAGEETHRLLWSEYHYISGDYSRAIALARPSYADPSLRRRSMIVMARSLRKLGKRAEAASVYESFVRAYPNDGLAPEALYAAGALYRQDDRAADASRVLDQLRRSYPSTFHGWAAAIRRADEFSRDGESAEAAAIYEQWLARSRRTDEAALYYLARERERGATGSGGLILDELRALNPFSFYVTPDVPDDVRGPLRGSSGGTLRGGPGSLSDWLARADAEREVAYQRVLAAAAASGGSGDRESDAAIERGLLFLEAGLRDWAERELDVARGRSGASAENSLMLARAYEDYAMPWRSVRLYERARTSLPWEERRSHTEEFRFLTHPLPYPAQVLDNAAKNGVAPHLIYGMIREESRFEADVVSRAGAVGLMQLMPGTARRIAAQLDLGMETDDRLDDPAVNVSIGVWYAADLLREGKGSVSWMLAAYNAGPGAADRWIEPGTEGGSAIAAVESIDYKETRGYVKRVVESANVYHALYFSGARAGASPR